MKGLFKKVVGGRKAAVDVEKSCEDNHSAPKKSKKEDYIKKVMEKSGWDYEHASADMEDAKMSLGMSYKDYVKYNFHNIIKEERKEKYDEIKAHNERLRVQREKNIARIMEGTGWTHEETVAKIRSLKKKMNMTYKDYAKYKLYNIPEDRLEREYNLILVREKDKDKKKRKNKRLLSKTMEITGWDLETAKEKMDTSKKNSGAEYKDYVAYEFWDVDEETQKTYFTKGCANYIKKKYNVNKDNYAYFKNKDLFNEAFSDFLGRSWSRNRDITFDEFKDTFKDEKRIIYKPLAESCGKGIEIFELNEDNIEEIYNKITAFPIGILEGVIVQHPEMSRFSKNSVNTIRAISVNDNGNVEVAYAAFRMGGGDSIVDNFHNGGILAIIDVKTGEVITDAIDLKGNRYSEHPSTGEVIKGFKVPYWDEVVAMLKKAGTVIKGVGYVGWDVAITENGPVLIEGNTNPAPNVLQLPFANEKKGMRYVFEKYL